MTDFSPFIRPLVSKADRLNPAKILLIFNTDSSLSAQVADYYQSARKIGHKLGLALGLSATVSSTGLYADTVVPVADYIALHQIEAIICSVQCPLFFNALNNPAFSYGSRNSFDALLGGALYCRDVLNNLPTAGRFTVNAREVTTAKTRTGLTSIGVLPVSDPTAPDGLSYDWTVTAALSKLRDGGGKLRPFGRIGVPAHSGTAVENYTETVRMIDDALWAEQQTNKKQIAIGVHSRVNRIAPPWQWMAYEFAQAAGHISDFYVRSYGVTDQSWFAKAPKWDYAGIMAGTETVVADAYVGGALVNLDINHAFKNSLSPSRGAWGWDGSSYNFEQVAALIQKGGCAGIATIAEPFEYSLIDAASLMNLALRGWSLMEINYLGQNQLWRMSVFGDPLYRPFPVHGLTDGEVSVLTDQTPDKTAALTTKANQLTLINIDHQISVKTTSKELTWHA